MEQFTEQQHFRQWWLWLIMVSAVIVPTVLTANELGWQHLREGNNMAVLFSGFSVPAAIAVLLYFYRLDTRVDASGVAYKIFPFQASWKMVSWGDITKVYIRQYRPIPEYGGWGIRYGLGGKGMAYNVSGNIGLQLVKKDGKRLLIGTNKPGELATFLDELVKQHLLDRQSTIPETGETGGA